MNKSKQLPVSFQFCNSSVKTDQKSTILGLLTLLSYEFEQIEVYDNQIFKHSLKQSADNFKKQLDKTFETYYQNKSDDMKEVQMNVLNDLCHKIERSINLSYNLAEKPDSVQNAYLEDFKALNLKYQV